jgi:hypothetical protein
MKKLNIILNKIKEVNRILLEINLLGYGPK